MHAAAEGHSTLGIPRSVGREFAAADPGGKLPASAKDSPASLGWLRDFKNFARGLMAFLLEEEKEGEHDKLSAIDTEFNETEHSRDESGKFSSGGSKKQEYDPAKIKSRKAWAEFDEVKYKGDFPNFSSLLGSDWTSHLPVNKTRKQYMNEAHRLMIEKYGEDPPFEEVPPELRGDAHDEEPKGRAASACFFTPEGKILFVKRSPSEENWPDTWSWPGGKCDGGESAYDAVRRECKEELGQVPEDDGQWTEVETKRTPHGWDHTTFACPVESEFEPTLNSEHTEHAWRGLDELPEPLHPGVKSTLEGLRERLADDANFEEGKHPRADNGQFGKGGAAVAPGSKSIPEGSVRRFHATSKRSLEGIGKEGLKATSNPGGKEKVFSFNNYKDAAHRAGAEGYVVEFHHDKEHYVNDPKDWNSSVHGTSGVPVENILHVHEPWHNLYHDAKEHGISPEKLRRAGLEEYDRAAEELEKTAKDADFRKAAGNMLQAFVNLTPLTERQAKLARVTPEEIEEQERQPTANVAKDSRFVLAFDEEEKPARDNKGRFVIVAEDPLELFGAEDDEQKRDENGRWTVQEGNSSPVEMMDPKELTRTENYSNAMGLRITEIVKHWRAGGSLPAIEVVKEDGKTWITDGHHRYDAAKLLRVPIGTQLKPKAKDASLKPSKVEDPPLKTKIAKPVVGDVRFVIALDEMIAEDKDTVRSFDDDQRMHVEKSNLTKANVCPYWGREIPGFEELQLDPEKQYNLYRHPDELAKPEAVASFNRIPVLERHIPVDAANHNEKASHVIGTTGSDAIYEHPYVSNSLAFWPQHAIDDIESKRKKELSAGYHYRPDMMPGKTEDGEPYDGVMRDIRAQHVALVPEGRVGSDVVVADTMSAAYSWADLELALRGLDTRMAT